MTRPTEPEARDFAAPRAPAERPRGASRYRPIFDAIDQGWFVIEVLLDAGGQPVDYRFVEVNAVFERESGIASPVGRTIREVLPELEPRWIERYGKVALTGVAARFVDSSATTGRTYEVNAFKLPDSDALEVAVLFRDVTRQSAAEAALREREQQLRLATQAAGVGTWVLDFATGRGTWSVGSAIAEAAGRTSLTAGDWLDGIHPDDRERVGRAWAATVDHDEPYRIEFRLVPTAGEEESRWVLSHGHVERDGDGSPVRAAGVVVDITERKAAELRLERQRRRERAYLDRLPVGVWFIDGDGTPLYGNAEAYRIWGLAANQAPLGFEAYKARLHDGRELRTEEWAGYQAAVAGIAVQQQLRITAFDGEQRDIENSGVPVRDESGQLVGAVTMNLDVTETRRAQDQMRQTQSSLLAEQERMKLAMAIADAGTWDMDLLTNKLLWSESHFTLLGYEPTSTFEATLDMIWEAIHPDDLERVTTEWRRAEREHDVFRSDHRLRKADGQYLWVAAAGRFSYDDGGRPIRFVGIFFDVSYRRAAEQALRDADRRKDEFLATLAHELRNPLAPISSAISVLRRIGGTEQARDRMLAVMERQVGHLVRLVDDLLEVSRITRGRVELRKGVVELGSLLRLALEPLEEQAARTDHRMTVRIPPSPVLLEGDSTRLSQVVSNLVGNALKYTPDGGAISVTLDVDGPFAVLEVVDDGTGIPPEMLQRVFELFTQVDQTLGRAKGGLGIGLALVKQLVELHGGSVTAHSAGIGRGARFTVRLPLLHVEAQDATVDAAGEPPSTGRPLRVLVVDDNVDAATSLAEFLQIEGHQARAVFSGESGVQAASAFKPHWVILDLGMPGMSGYQAAVALRNLPDGPTMRLAALTGWGQDTDRARTAQAGFDVHFVKPVDPSLLLERLNVESPDG